MMATHEGQGSALDGEDRGGPDARQVTVTDAVAESRYVSERGARHELRFSRRWFLAGLAGAIAGIAGIAALFGRSGGTSAGGRDAGQGARGALADFPVRTVDKVPSVGLEEWVIEVDGLVERPVRVDHDVWAGLPRTEETVDFNCVEGWTVDQVKWAGVKPAELLRLARPRAGAGFVTFHAYDGSYVDSLPMSLVDDEYTLLADTIDGLALPPEHGGPVRLVVPRQLAYKSVKFVTRMEVTDREARGYWERYGYAADAPAAPGAGASVRPERGAGADGVDGAGT
jgi:hypothetical protein